MGRGGIFGHLYPLLHYGLDQIDRALAVLAIDFGPEREWKLEGIKEILEKLTENDGRVDVPSLKEIMEYLGQFNIAKQEITEAYRKL